MTATCWPTPSTNASPSWGGTTGSRMPRTRRRRPTNAEDRSAALSPSTASKVPAPRCRIPPALLRRELGPPAWPSAGYSTVLTDVVEPGGACASPPPRPDAAPHDDCAHQRGGEDSRTEFPSHVSHLVLSCPYGVRGS